MIRLCILKRFAALPTLSLLIATVASGCGDNAKFEGVDQQSTANQQAARTAAFGNANNPAAKKVKGGRAPLSAEASARQRAGR